MEIRRSRNAVIVGVFVVIAMAVFILAVFTLGGERKTFTKKFPIKVLFTDINGLKEGNNVWFSGVKVGTVKTIDLKSKSNVEVTLSIEEKARPFISKDAMAKISSEGFLGNKIVIIYGGTATSPPVENGDYIIVLKPTGNEDIMATLQASNKNLLEITNNLKAISKKIADGEGTVGKLLNDPSIANTLQSTLYNFKTVSSNSKKIVANINAFTERINAESSSINKLFADTLLYDSIKNTIAQLQEAVRSANDFANNMDAFAENLKNASSNLSDTTKPTGLILNDTEVAADIQTTIKNLKAASKKLDEDLKAAQHNFLLRGYFKKHPSSADTTSQ